MKLPRRKLLRLAAGAAALPAMSRFAWAQPYPSRPVRIVVPVLPRGALDIIARLIGQWLRLLPALSQTSIHSRELALFYDAKLATRAAVRTALHGSTSGIVP
jgi:hypothetical protein